MLAVAVAQKRVKPRLAVSLRPEGYRQYHYTTAPAFFFNPSVLISVVHILSRFWGWSSVEVSFFCLQHTDAQKQSSERACVKFYNLYDSNKAGRKKVW